MVVVINALDQIGRLPNLSVAKPLSALRYVNALMGSRVVNSCKGGKQCSRKMGSRDLRLCGVVVSAPSKPSCGGLFFIDRPP